MKLSPEDRALVRESRANLVRMRDDPSSGVPGTTTDCALCGEYNSGSSHCTRCPVMLVTGKTGCRGTPVDDTRHTYRKMMWVKESDAYLPAVIAYQEATQRFIDWVDEHLLPAGDDASIECLVDQATGIRRIVDKRLFTEAEMTKMRAEFSRPLSLEQQLPSEITRAAEGEEEERS